jgi:putative endopeptidase
MKINFRPFFTGILLVSTCLNQGDLLAQSGKKKSKPITFDVSYLDKSVKPQDDFFRFANGTWIKKNPIPPSESRWGSFNELEQNNQKKLTELLENAKNGQFEQGSIQFLLGSYYASYTNMDQRNKLGLTPIKEDLAKATQLIQYTGIHDVVAYQHRYSIRSLFGFGVGQDLKNVNSNISYLSQGGIGLPNKDYYLKEDKKDILAKYEAYIAELFVLSGNDATTAKAKAKSIVEFETKLAQKMMSPAELRIPENSYNKFSKTEVEKMLSNFNLEGYLSKVGSQVMDTIVVGQPEFIKAVNEMVKSESLETWKNYLEWKTLNFYSKHLSEAFVKANFNFYQGVLSGKSQMKPLNERAINELTGMTIGEALGQLFVEKYFSVEAKNRVNSLVDNLLITFEERINKLDWMTDITKKEALTKLKAIGRKLGYP